MTSSPLAGPAAAPADRSVAAVTHIADSHDADAGNTVIVIEHHQAVMAHADWIINLGPGARADGGRVVFTGTPSELVSGPETLTARHLREYVGN